VLNVDNRETMDYLVRDCGFVLDGRASCQFWCHALVLVMLEGVPNARTFVGRRCPALPNYFMGP